MKINEAYNHWATSYDTSNNATRDVEGQALRSIFANTTFSNVLEWGCGTGKNTEWLATIAARVTALDFSEGMLAKAAAKIQQPNVQFQQGDITKTWTVAPDSFDLVSCSLMLEHIENLSFVFQQAFRALQSGGLFYLGELHPFKQYQGSKARFENSDGSTTILECHLHHLSDYWAASQQQDFECIHLGEWRAETDIETVPRVLTMVFRKQ